ncbi:hypothetical protein T439DRAFT_309959 [Meredithblackwellia eburnea MCA 4105]
MNLFRKSSISSSASSIDSNQSSTDASSVSSKGIKPTELPFLNNSASPNSRILNLSPPPPLQAPQFKRSSSQSSDKSNSTSTRRASTTSTGSGSGSGSNKKQPAPPPPPHSSDEESESEQEDKPNPPRKSSPSKITAGVAALAVGTGAKSSKTKSPTPTAESSESEESDDDQPQSTKKAAAGISKKPVPPTKSSSTKSTTSTSKKPIPAVPVRSASPESFASSTSSLSEDDDAFSLAPADEDDESVESVPAPPKGKAHVGPGASEGRARPDPPRRKMSKAARLAEEARESPANARPAANKALNQLTFEDVKLSEQDLREDIGVVWKAMHLFLNSRMIEAEDICTSAADHRLYYSVGYALIQTIKSLATFEPSDLEAAIQCCKDSLVITQLLRKKDHGLLESGIRLAKGSTSVNSIKGMTTVQRHAELIYAECTLLKAVLGIIYSGDFIAFLKEALNMRNAYSIYRVLAKYVETTDASYGGEDPTLDQDFRSGVFLGNGLISVILSLLPSTVLKIMEVFGFTGDCKYGLDTLMKGGKWTAGRKEPGMEVEREGIRRQVCDMVLLVHHLVTASYLPVGGVDVPTASNVLHYNLDRYPNGVFFLYFAGRLHSTETQLKDAVDAFHDAINAQREFIQLAHICYWDLGLVSLAMGNHQKGYECFNILDKESNWSKAIYHYAKATMLYEQGNSKDRNQVNTMMKNVPDLMQRIAGKSIPLEKFVARRARKFVDQGNRLCLPGVELAYVLNCIQMSPRYVLFETHLDQVSGVLADLHNVKDPKSYGNGDEYWDDFCLAHLLRGIILRFIAHPEPYTKPRPEKPQIPVKEADEQAMISYNNVLKHAKDIVHDNHLVWFTHYELGRLYEAKGEWAKAKEQFEMVMSGKMEGGRGKTKGKVSLQNMAILRSNSALNTLREKGRI